MNTRQPIPFGESEISIEIPYSRVKIITPPSVFVPNSPNNFVSDAFYNPVGKINDSIWNPDAVVAVAINDQTRPLPHAIILPKLIKFLEQNKIKRENIHFFIATGTHRQLSTAEIQTILPDGLHEQFYVHCHDCDDRFELQFLGETHKRTPVYINKLFFRADVKIVIGNIEPHHFMGFSGGMKTAAIGLTGRATIEKNHSMLTDPQAKLGKFFENPMRQDVEEIGRMIGIDLALNVVLDHQNRIIAAFWGEPYEVMTQGIPVSLEICDAGIAQAECQYDLIIASPGGFPKDINLYQAQKAITNACLFSKPGGVIVLMAECRDGVGNQRFLDYLESKQNIQAILEDFQHKSFEVGPHKAYQLALQTADHTIILVSTLDEVLVRKCMLLPAANLTEALAIAKPLLPLNPRTAVLPHATHCLPKMNR